MSIAALCWKCGADLKDVPQPLGRRAECLVCGAELHVCRQCRHYAPGKAKQCRELAAEEVRDKTRANFCEWFQAGAGAPAASGPAAGRASLDALFGGPTPPAACTDAHAGLDRLFGKD